MVKLPRLKVVPLEVMLLAGFATTAVSAIAPVEGEAPAASLHWEQLPPIPDREGFASPFAGESGGALIVAGGANFPDKRPWEGGTKTWYDSVFVLESADGPWKTGFRLPRPTAYGVSVTTPDGIVCIGGGNAEHYFRDVFRMQWDGAKVACSPLPKLPQPCAFMSGAIVNGTIFISGGIETPGATTCLKTFWSLDLAQVQKGWQQLEPCPGSERMLAVAGSTGGSFFLFSGVRLTAGPQGKPVREYLRDGWRYTPGKGWQRLAEMPRPAVAAPSPAPLAGASHLLVISGDDGTKTTFKPEAEHPGFPHAVLSYDVNSDKWQELGDSPISRATVPTVPWLGRFVVPNGEARPGYRTPQVWTLRTDPLP
jgi:N-acetylneuraminic acid mutarotase